MSERNLYQRLVDVMRFMGAIGKGGQTTYGEKYSYHKIDDIDDKLREALIECGVVAVISDVTDHKLEHFVDESRQGKITWYAECIVTIKLINADNPTEQMNIVGWGQGLDFSDKATGKAFSYAAKAAYLSAFHLRGQPDSEAVQIRRLPSPKKPAVITARALELINELNACDSTVQLHAMGEKFNAEELPETNDAVRPAYVSRFKELKSQGK